MELNTNENDWMENAPLLARFPGHNSFKVPDGYFSLSAARLRRIADNRDFGVPENYFEELPDQIESAIISERLRASGPGSAYTVPPNYFAELESRLSGLAVPAKPALVRKLYSAWIGYAAAACVVFVIAISFLLNPEPRSLEAQLETIPEQEIIKYLQANMDIGDLSDTGSGGPAKIDAEITADDLEEYINTSL